MTRSGSGSGFRLVSVCYVSAMADKPALGIHQILEALPHRFPFLLVDRVLELTDQKIVRSRTSPTTSRTSPATSPARR